MNSRDLSSPNTTKITDDAADFTFDANSNQKIKLSFVNQNIVGFTNVGLFGKQSSTTNIEKIEKVEKIKKTKEQYQPQGKEVAANIKDKGYLEIKIIQKMLNRFLLEKKITQEALAQKLDTTAQELGQLLHPEKTRAILLLSALIAKINLPLIKLYCETKWP